MRQCLGAVARSSAALLIFLSQGYLRHRRLNHRVAAFQRPDLLGSIDCLFLAMLAGTRAGTRAGSSTWPRVSGQAPWRFPGFDTSEAAPRKTGRDATPHRRKRNLTGAPNHTNTTRAV